MSLSLPISLSHTNTHTFLQPVETSVLLSSAAVAAFSINPPGSISFQSETFGETLPSDIYTKISVNLSMNFESFSDSTHKHTHTNTHTHTHTHYKNYTLYHSKILPWNLKRCYLEVPVTFQTDTQPPPPVMVKYFYYCKVMWVTRTSARPCEIGL